MEERPVRLVLVDLSHHVGPVERSLWELATRLAPERYAVRAWLSADACADALAEALESRGIGVERFAEPNSRWDWRTPFHWWLRLRRERPQLVHVHHGDAPNALRVGRAAMADGVPVLITRHDTTPSDDAELRRVYSRADAVTTVTRAEMERLVGEWSLARDRVRWIPYGVDVPGGDAERAEARAWRDQLGTRPLCPLWVCPLRLDPHRGHEVLIDAAAELHRRDLDFVLAFSGDGPLRPELERRVQHRGLTGFAHFLDGVETPGALLAAADVVVFPVLQGSLPLMLLEAMARGRAVIASATRAVQDVIEDGRDGRLVRPGDSAALTDALEALHRRPDMAARLGRAAARIRDELAWNRVVDAFESVYDDILGLASFAPEPSTGASR